MTVTFSTWIDGFWDDELGDEAEDMCFRAGLDEHGWIYLKLDDGKVLALRPSDLLRLIAGRLP